MHLRRGGKEGLSPDRRVVICKKFISTFKKREREPEGLAAPDGGWRWGLGVGVVGKPRRPLPASPGREDGTGHKLTDSRTRSRAHGSRINYFIYTLHTLCTALRRPGRSEEGSTLPSACLGTGRGLGVQLEHRGAADECSVGVAPTCSQGGAGGGRLREPAKRGAVCTSGGWKWLPDGVAGTEHAEGG